MPRHRRAKLHAVRRIAQPLIGRGLAWPLRGLRGRFGLFLPPLSARLLASVRCHARLEGQRARLERQRRKGFAMSRRPFA